MVKKKFLKKKKKMKKEKKKKKKEARKEKEIVIDHLYFDHQSRSIVVTIFISIQIF